MFLLAAPRRDAAEKTARIAWRERRRKSRARSCVTLLLRRQRLDQPLEVSGLFQRRNQRQAIVHHHYQIVNAIHDDSTRIGLHNVVGAVDDVDIAAGHIAELVLVAYSTQSSP